MTSAGPAGNTDTGKDIPDATLLSHTQWLLLLLKFLALFLLSGCQLLSMDDHPDDLTSQQTDKLLEICKSSDAISRKTLTVKRREDTPNK